MGRGARSSFATPGAAGTDAGVRRVAAATSWIPAAGTGSLERGTLGGLILIEVLDPTPQLFVVLRALQEPLPRRWLPSRARRKASATLRSQEARSKLVQIALSVGDVALPQSNEGDGFASAARRRSSNSTWLSKCNASRPRRAHGLLVNPGDRDGDDLVPGRDGGGLAP